MRKTLEEDEERQRAKNPRDTEKYCESGTIEGSSPTLPKNDLRNEGEDGGRFPSKPGDACKIAQRGGEYGGTSARKIKKRY